MLLLELVGKRKINSLLKFENIRIFALKWSLFPPEVPMKKKFTWAVMFDYHGDVIYLLSTIGCKRNENVNCERMSHTANSINISNSYTYRAMNIFNLYLYVCPFFLFHLFLPLSRFNFSCSLISLPSTSICDRSTA